MSGRSTGCSITLTALFLSLLCACSTAPEAMSEETIDPAPANLIAECPGLEPLPDRKILPGELVEADVAVSRAYIECATRHRGLIRWAEGVTAKRKARGPAP